MRVRGLDAQLLQLGLDQPWDAPGHYTAVGSKTGGSYPGAIYQKTQKWLGKPGSFDENKTSVGSVGSVMRRGYNRDAVKEKIGADCYLALSKTTMNSSFRCPAYQLTHLPLLNDFTRQDMLAVAIHQSLQRPDALLVHVLSEMVLGYHDLCDARVRVGNQIRSLEEHLTGGGAVPNDIQTSDGRVLPLRGLVEVLVASRLLMDVDVLGDSLKNAGFTVQTDTKGEAYAQVVKIDPGFVFSFAAPQNLLRNTIFPRPGDRTLSDEKDVQAGSNGSLVIKWAQFSESQQDHFREHLVRGIAWLRRPEVLEFLLVRNGAFNAGAEEVLLRAELVQEYTQLIRDNLAVQERIYTP